TQHHRPLPPDPPQPLFPRPEPRRLDNCCGQVPAQQRLLARAISYLHRGPASPSTAIPAPRLGTTGGRTLKLKHLSSLQGTTKVLNPLSGMRSGKPTLGFPGTPCCASAYHCSWPPLVRPTSARLNVKRSSLGSGRVTTRLLSG